MKIFKFILTLAICTFSFSGLMAQTAADDYFVGKWDVLIKGTPNGDVTVPLTIEKVEGKFKAKLFNPETKEENEVSSIEIAGTEATVGFSMAGYDLTMTLSKKDDDHATGKLVDMFDVEATRKK